MALRPTNSRVDRSRIERGNVCGRLGGVVEDEVGIADGWRIDRRNFCPACGSENLRWQWDSDLKPSRAFHPALPERDGNYVCKDCDAGFMKAAAPFEITWARPYWVEKSAAR